MGTEGDGLSPEAISEADYVVRIPYPFAKYGFVVLPDFQYGGMEHTGATLYNDRRIFLGPHPSMNHLLVTKVLQARSH